jgi:hypothetical protein
MRKGKDSDPYPYLRLKDPDPDRPNTCGPCGSGSPKVKTAVNWHGLQLTSTPLIADREGVPTERPGPLHDEGAGAAGHQGGHAQDHGHNL